MNKASYTPENGFTSSGVSIREVAFIGIQYKLKNKIYLKDFILNGE